MTIFCHLCCLSWFQNLLFRINFLPGRERDVWTREGMQRERNGSLPPSRAAEAALRAALPGREQGGYLGGRWGGGEGSTGALQRRAPRSPPVLHQHHQPPPDHPHFIPPPVRWTFCRFTQISQFKPYYLVRPPRKIPDFFGNERLPSLFGNAPQPNLPLWKTFPKIPCLLFCGLPIVFSVFMNEELGLYFY